LITFCAPETDRANEQTRWRPVVGLDKGALKSLDAGVALGRIRQDLASDFIPAPHYAAVFENAGEDLFDQLRSRLSSGQYEPQGPIVLEVLKATGATRPGAILVPEDRLIYQLLADQLAPVIETQIARDRVYSNVVSDPDPQFTMFEDQGEAWRSMLARVNEYCVQPDVEYVLKADVANCFERLYQHKLINLLSSAGSPTALVSLLEKILSAWTEKDSHGIPQGMFPSDLFGNFYLTGVDAQFELMSINGVRFVDDIYLFFDRLNRAREALVKLCGWLRKDGLSLNEQKSGVRSAERVLHEETDLDKKFNDARDEIAAAMSESGPYGGDADIDPEELKEIDLQAVIRLYEAREGERARSVDRIDAFCLPLFRALGADVALEGAASRLPKRPHLTKLYSAYLASLAGENDDALTALERQVISEDTYCDWQLIWPLLSLAEMAKCDKSIVQRALKILVGTQHSAALRAICAILVGKHGSAPQRLVLRNHHADEQSMYVRGAMVFAAQYFPSTERNTCLAGWGSQSPINALIAKSVKKS
jgi:hypothetical protein